MKVWAPLQDVCETMQRRVCPLYAVDESRRVWMEGSGVPFDTGHLQFVLTAAHVFGEDHGPPLRLITLGKAGPRLLTGQRFAYGFEPEATIDADIALIGLSPDDVMDLRYRFQFAVPVATATLSSTPDTRYIIVGYPETKNRVQTNRRLKFQATPVFIVAHELIDVTRVDSPGKSEKHHFAVRVPKRAVRTFTGERLDLPQARGMSGGGVWQVEVDSTGRLCDTPQLVGIGIEHSVAAQVFIATRVQVGIPLARQYHALVRTQSGFGTAGA